MRLILLFIPAATSYALAALMFPGIAFNPLATIWTLEAVTLWVAVHLLQSFVWIGVAVLLCIILAIVEALK